MTPDEIRKMRIELELTQDQLAEVAESNTSTISKMETGQRPPPPRMVQLLRAYKQGFRPENWPDRRSNYLGGGVKQ